MARDLAPVFGRDAELAELDAALADTTADRHTLVVVRGADGVGRTALLAAAAARWRQRGVVVLSLGFRDVEAAPWDRFGAGVVIGALREHCERTGDSSLAELVNAAAALCTAGTYDSARDRVRLLSRLTAAFGRLRTPAPVVVVADDVDAVPSPAFALAPACLPGLLVVAACRRTTDCTSAAADLAHAADRRMDLTPLPDECAAALVAQRIGVAVDDSLLIALRRALGPLAGHPGTILSTVDQLRSGVVPVHGRACLSGTAPVALAAGHPLVDRVRRLGDAGRDLVLAVATGDLRVDGLPSLAAATGRDVTEYGRAVDVLVAEGGLACDETGQLTCACPALAEAVRAEAPHAEAPLHRALAEHLLAQDGDRATIAEHVAGAGDLLPATPALGHLLRVEADLAAEAGHHDRAARLYLAAPRHSDERDPRVLAATVHALLHSGQYAALGAVLDGSRLDDLPPARLARTAVLVSLHTGDPVPAAVRDRVDRAGDPRDRELIRWCDGWLAGDPGLLPAAHQLAFRRDRRNRRTELAAAVAHADLAALVEIRAGYRIPATGPLAHHHRVVSGYAAGHWSAALSSARELALTGTATPAHQLGRLVAAEICVGRDDLGQAQSWLGAAGRGFVAVRAWVRSGLLAASGDTTGALAAGWAAYFEAPARGDRVRDRARLLARLAVVATDGGYRDAACAAFAAMEGLHRRANDQEIRELFLFTRGLVTEDPASVLASARLARRRGHRPALLASCLVLGELAEEPAAWLYEAHDLAEELACPAAKARARTLMRVRGVGPPRGAGDRHELSDTERRIVDLVRGGRTNRQIAATLRISEKTVEAKVSRLLGRTGNRSRVGLATASATASALFLRQA
jgi:DNA-binding CsgD family transcriptional regulator